MAWPNIQPVTPPQVGIGVGWAEFIGRTTGWTETMQFGLDESSATIVHLIKGSDLYNGSATGFVPSVLGYPVLKNNMAVSRVIPAQHPLFIWMYAVKIVNVEGVQFKGKNSPSNPIAAYTYYKVTVLYKSLPYRILQDTQLEDDGGPWEWDRFVVKKNKPISDIIQGASTSWKWGPGATSTGELMFPVSRRISKLYMSWTWCQVPEWAILTADSFPTNLLTVNNNVNLALDMGVWGTTLFAGCLPGTLFLDSFELEPHESPCPASILWSGVPGGSPPRVYNVTYNMLYFNPDTVGPPYGHNLQPDPLDTSGFWWPVVGDNAGSPDFVDYEDFSQLFVSLV